MTMMYNGSETREVVLGHEIDDLLLGLRGLVLVGDLLAERGATEAELSAHAEEADRMRAQLAELIAGRAAEAA